MSKGDELKFEGGAATNTEGEQGNPGRKNRDHAHDDMAATQKSLGFLSVRSFEQGQGADIPTDSISGRQHHHTRIN
jgi:hypothetical protein